MSNETRPPSYEAADTPQGVSQADAVPPPTADGPTDAALVPQPILADESMRGASSDPEGTATPKPAAANLVDEAGGEPRITASPTTSEFEQAGFYPVHPDRSRKHPGTPSDRVAEEERRNARTVAMREKGPAASQKPKSTHVAARDKRKQAAPMSNSTRRDELNGGSMLASFRFPPFESTRMSSQQPGIPREAAEPPLSAPATAVHASLPDTTHASQVDHPAARPSFSRPPSPHSGRFTRPASGSFTISRINANKKDAFLQQQLLTRCSNGQRGPSPSRAESSSMGAAHDAAGRAFQNDAFQPARAIKTEPISPFIIPRLPDEYYDSDEDPYLSPSEEKARRDTQRKRAAACAAQRQRDFEANGLTEIPAPARPPTADPDAMSIADSSDSDDDFFANTSLANGGVAINNPLASEDELSTAAALYKVLANARIRVTAAGERGPINGLGRNHYWRNACPDQRQAIMQAKGYRILARALGIIGHPEIDPRDPAMLAFVNKTIRDMFGADCRAFATRIVSPAGAGPDEEVEPGVFAITGLTEAQAAFLQRYEWILAGALQLEVHDVNEVGSDFINTWSGAMVSKSRFERGLIPKLLSHPGVQAVAASHAAQKGISQGSALALITATLHVDSFDVVLPRSPGVVTRQFVVNGGSFLSADNQRRLREYTADIVVDTHLLGRATVWHGWHCIVCNSVTHPTGMCPSRILEGWAEAADELMRRLKEKRGKRREEHEEQPKPRGEDNKRGGHGGGRGGRGGGGASGNMSHRGRNIGI
ncbi:hypothetical protein AURDEDRAFT_172632 [Auricularia subglabra TFB-10046 SS5]|nr:hypothetical protein AURDEDRAFT_172632 [Auricularia subglabra TFB-10046 SS5]